MSRSVLLQLSNQASGMLKANVKGITDAESLDAAVRDGNPLNWVLGHIIYWRNELVGMAGGDKPWKDGTGDQYRGNPGQPAPASFDAATALDMASLIAAWDRVHAGFASRLEAMTDDDLAAMLPNGKMTLGGMLTALLGHELYHVGQLGLLRRAAGRAVRV